MIFIYTTCKDEHEAKTIATKLLEKKLIACANFFPSQSMYKWKGKIVGDDEIVMILKTTDKNFSKIEKEITTLHSYDVPCITKISVVPNSSYGKYVDGEMK